MMKFFGLTPKDYEDENTVELWLDNEQAVRVFIAIGRQWRFHSGGAYALDYNVLYHRLDRMGLAPADYERLENEVHTLESAALAEMNGGEVEGE